MSRTSVAGAALALLLLASTTACSGDQPAPITTPASQTNQTNQTSQTETTEKKASAELDPCTLLTESDAKNIGFTYPGEPGAVGEAELCTWTVPGDGLIEISSQDSGLKDRNMNPKRSFETKIGEYDAVRQEAPSNTPYMCLVAIGVTDSSAVVVRAALDRSSDDTPAACERATRIAELIAPRIG
ncbi:DUF3558 domain-containing protein [Saccharothrix stipae]